MATGYYLLDNKQRIPQCGKVRRDDATASGTIILHDAEGGTDLVGVDMGAENVGRYILDRDSYGSYHDLVDRDTHIPMAPLDYETWHSVPDNPWSVGICVAWTKADLPRMTYAQRRSYYVPLARVVLLRVAEFARRGIKVPIGRMLTAAETQARKPGISTHSRTDPARRSDPFGTDSIYEREFLAVLAAEASQPAQEDDMSAEDSRKIGNIDAGVDRLEKLLGGSTKNASVAEVQWAVLRTVRALRADVAANRAAITTLAEARGVDPERIYALVDANTKAAAEAALDGLSITLTTDTEDQT